jgi:flagellar biosynthetic protein FlhB
MDSSAQDKNLPATAKRLQEARDEGQIARSRDLGHLAVLGGGALILLALLPAAFDGLRTMLRAQLRFDHTVLREPTQALQRMSEGFGQGLMIYLPLGVLTLALALVVAVASGSWGFTTKPLMPKLSKINPLSGIGRLFSKQQVVETAKLVFITAVVAVVAWRFLASHLQGFASLVMQPLETGLGQLGHWMVSGVGLLLVVVAVVAAIDFPVQKFLHAQQLRMSHQEVKEEFKQAEGDPTFKGKRRAKARELAQRLSISAVPRADLVVMNPTHYAVAIRYDDASMGAPRVIAKGTDLLAMKIRDVAKASNVPVLQSPMLARALYANAEIDEEIPSALYTAVAQVLAYVYQLKAALRGEGAMPAEPQPQVPPELDPHFKKKPVSREFVE